MFGVDLPNKEFFGLTLAAPMAGDDGRFYWARAELS
jgi:hypothetical protein